MSALSIQQPYPIFTDDKGEPLENGYIWIGTANLDPQTNPINVYWDAALTQLAGQPIRTLAGYPSNSGTPARLYVNSDYSIRVMNKNGSTVYSAPAATERYGNVITAATIDFSHAITYPQGTVGTALQLTVNVKNAPFNAVGDGAADDTAAIQAALDFVEAAGGGEVFLPAGDYLCGQLTLRDKVSIRGVGNATRFITKAISANFLDYNDSLGPVPALTNLKLSDFYVDCTAQVAGNGLYITGLQDSEISGVTIYNAQGFGWLIFGSVRCKYLRNTINITRQWDGMTISAGGSTDNVIEGNIVIDSYDSGIGFAATINTTCVGNYVRRSKISGNWFAPGIDAAGAKNAVITGNYVLGNQFGISLLQHPNTGFQPKRVTVTGNTVADGEYGVIVGPVAVIPPAVSEPTTRDGIVISGNTIFSQDVQGVAVVGGDSLGVTITGNQISYSGTGIGLNGPEKATLLGNMLFANSTGVNTFGSSNVSLNMAFNVFQDNVTPWVGSSGSGTTYILHNKGLAYPAGTINHEEFASNWDFGGQLRLGGYHLWVDATGDLRIKSGAPTSDTDGVVVGTQT